MNLLADECVYQVTVKLLRQQGHDVITVQESKLAGHSDKEVLSYSTATDRALITNDAHFSNILLFPPSQHKGVIVLKIRPSVLPEVHAVLNRLLHDINQQEIRQTLAIVDRNKYRIFRQAIETDDDTG
jgi:predicted nuclease of predicted toxin-antitoxin system